MQDPGRRTPRRSACTIGGDDVRLDARSPRTSARPPRSSTRKYEGTELTVAFNPDYLAAGVEAVVGDEVVLDDARRAEAGGRPRPVGRDDYLYLLMPVRVP